MSAFSYLIQAGLAFILLFSLMAGCAAPTGDSGGRISVSEGTESELRGEAIPLTELDRFSDEVVERMANEIAEIPEIQNLDKKAIFALGDLENKTRHVPTGDFEQFQHRVRYGVMSSRLLSRRFIFVSDPSRVRRLQQMMSSGQRDVGSVLESGSGSQRGYDPNVSYMLVGDFFEADRGPVQEYTLSMSLQNLATGQIVFEKQMPLKRQVQ